MSATGDAQRIASLDGLRALSIGLVILSHLAGTTGFPITLDQLHSTVGEVGNLGVRVFFLISGFLITTLLLKEHASTGRISLWQFYVRRAIRIFPAAYTLVAIVVLLEYLGVVELRPGEILRALTYTTNYGYPQSQWLVHLWSLSVEEQFYFIWPAAMVLLGPRRAGWFAAAQVLIAPVLRMIYWFKLPALRHFQGFETSMDPIALGCLLALCRNWLHAHAWYTKWARSLVTWVAPVVIATAMVLAEHKFVFYLLRDPVLNVALALVVDRVVTWSDDGVFAKFLNWRPVAYVGTLSYSLYLWQQEFTLRNSLVFVQSFPVNLLCACLAGLASFYLIEQPVLRRRSQIVKFLSQRFRRQPARA